MRGGALLGLLGCVSTSTHCPIGVVKSRQNRVGPRGPGEEGGDAAKDPGPGSRGPTGPGEPARGGSGCWAGRRAPGGPEIVQAGALLIT